MDVKTQNSNSTTAANLAADTIRRADASARASELINLAAQNPKAIAGPGQTRGARSLNEDITYTEATKEANATGHPTVNESFTDQAYEDKLLQPVGIGAKRKTRKNFYRPDEGEDDTETRQRSSLSKTVQRRLLDKAVGQPISILAKARVTSFNLAAFGWYTPLWAILQLPFALLMIVGLGSVYAIDKLTTADGGILNFIVAKLAQGVLTTLNFVTSIFGANFEEVALALMNGAYVIILAFGFLSLFSFSLAYIFLGCNPLSGDGAGLKKGMFLLAMVGYATPVLNMFPFILLYMAAVWLYPR